MAEAAADGALVLLSGGQDSAVYLAWALDRFARVETVGFAYGQRHAIELERRGPVRDAVAALDPAWAARLGPDRVLDLSVLGEVGVSALTADLPIEAPPGALPSTFVPGRNLVFLTFAAILARARDLRRLVGGMCETDFSGYPDCRDDALKALQVALNLGMEARLVIDTPLMWLDKAGTWALAEALGGGALVEAVVEETHTCYRGARGARHAWGYGCGACPACELRAAGWARWVAGKAASAGATGMNHDA